MGDINLVAPSPCECCGATGPLELCHDAVDPDIVVLLCADCRAVLADPAVPTSQPHPT